MINNFEGLIQSQEEEVSPERKAVMDAAIAVLPEQHQKEGLGKFMNKLMFSSGIAGGFELPRAQEVLASHWTPVVVGAGLAFLAHKGAKEVGLTSDWWLYWVPLIGGLIGGVAIETFRNPVKRNMVLNMIGM